MINQNLRKLFNIDELIATDEVQNALYYFLSSIGILIYFLSSLILLFKKKISIIKTRPFSFLLLNSLTNLFELIIDHRSLIPIKNIVTYLSYIFQFHLIISSINKLLSGKRIFKSEKNYSISKLLCIDLILALIIFPYQQFYEKSDTFDFFQYLIIIILILIFYEYVRIKIDLVAKYISENCKDIIIEIPYMEVNELYRIYLLLKSLWYINFIFVLIFYILKFFDILLKKLDLIHYIISLLFIVLKEAVIFVYFIILNMIAYNLKNYNTGHIVQTTEEDNSIFHGEKIKFEGDDEQSGKISNKENSQNFQIEIQDTEKNVKKEEYNQMENEDIEMENMDIENGKENKNNEEEKLDIKD